jgi:hypothetical protein
MKKVLILACCLLLLSCTAVDVEHYRDEEPQLDLRKYFVGTVDAWGMFQKRSGEGHWRGTAADVVGEAVGEVAGNALRWRYVLSLPVDDKVYDVHLDDWMYLIDENTLANRSFMSKFGVEVGQVTLFFRKRNE